MNHHLGKLCALFGVDSHDVPQEEDVVRSVVDFLGIENDLLELASLRKTLDHLYRERGRAERERERERVSTVCEEIGRPTFPGTPALRKTERASVGSTCFTSSPSSSLHSSYTQAGRRERESHHMSCVCVQHTNLIFLEPLLDELLLPLSQHRTTQLESLVLVELTALQEDTKILQERRRLAGWGGHCLESLDGLSRTQNTLQNKVGSSS